MQRAVLAVCLLALLSVSSASAVGSKNAGFRKLLGAQTGVLSVGLPVSVSVQVNAEPEADVLARGGNSGPDSWQWWGGGGGCNRIWQGCWRSGGWRNNAWGWNRRRA